MIHTCLMKQIDLRMTHHKPRMSYSRTNRCSLPLLHSVYYQNVYVYVNSHLTVGYYYLTVGS